LSWEKVNVLYCYSAVCHLAAAAAVEFTRKGFPVMEIRTGASSPGRKMICRLKNRR
jgi:hypothetical protein